MAAQGVLPGELSAPAPPLRVTLLRVVVVGGGIAAVLLGLWLGWNAIANARLSAAVAAVRARPQPLLPGDFVASPPSQDQTAMSLLRSAAAALVPGVDCPASSNLTYNGYRPYPPAWYQLEDKAIVADRRALALARQARAYPATPGAWAPLPPSPIGLKLNFTWFNAQRDLANHLGDAAVYASLHGDDAEAIERLRDELHQADVVDDGQSIIGRLVGIGIQAAAIAHLQSISADNLCIAGAANNPMPVATHPVPRQTIMLLIRQLLDVGQSAAKLQRTIISERMLKLDEMTATMADNRLLAPMLKLDAVRMLRDCDTFLKAAGMNNDPAGLAALAGVSPAPPPSLSHLVSHEFSATWFRLLETNWRVEAERRTTAVSLAARMYRDDHGHWPAELAALTPAYLPAVPADPYSTNGKPVGYLLVPATAVTPERPLVYFDPPPVTATRPSPPSGFTYGWNNTTHRQWLDLSLDVPPPAK